MVLCSSVHSFPLRLAAIGFDVRFFTNIFFAGEIPPKEIASLLKDLGLGEHLSTALIERHGGHIYDICMAIKTIKGSSMYWEGEERQRIQKSLDSCKSDVDKNRMIRILHDLAEKGFAPLDMAEDPVAEILSMYDVGGVVTDNSSISGLRDDVFCGGKIFCGVVPTKQFTRLCIALQLRNNARKYA